MHTAPNNTVPNPIKQSKRILRHTDVSNRLGVGPSTLFSMIAKGKFPKPFVIIPGGRAVGWLDSDVDAWIINRTAQCGEDLK